MTRDEVERDGNLPKSHWKSSTPNMFKAILGWGFIGIPVLIVMGVSLLAVSVAATVVAAPVMLLRGVLGGAYREPYKAAAIIVLFGPLVLFIVAMNAGSAGVIFAAIAMVLVLLPLVLAAISGFLGIFASRPEREHPMSHDSAGGD